MAEAKTFHYKLYYCCGPGAKGSNTKKLNNWRLKVEGWASLSSWSHGLFIDPPHKELDLFLNSVLTSFIHLCSERRTGPWHCMAGIGKKLNANELRKIVSQIAPHTSNDFLSTVKQRFLRLPLSIPFYYQAISSLSANIQFVHTDVHTHIF